MFNRFKKPLKFMLLGIPVYIGPRQRWRMHLVGALRRDPFWKFAGRFRNDPKFSNGKPRWGGYIWMVEVGSRG
jgi:hypothetical protein